MDHMLSIVRKGFCRIRVQARGYQTLVPVKNIGYKIVGANGRDVWRDEFKFGQTIYAKAKDDKLYFSPLAPWCTDLTYNLEKPLRYLQVSSLSVRKIENMTNDSLLIAEALNVDKEFTEEEWKLLSTGRVITTDGCQRCYRNGILNDPSPDKPAVIGMGGHMVHFSNGVVHRDNGPAITYDSGTVSYYKFGELVSKY
jgi:hypothetical protein